MTITAEKETNDYRTPALEVRRRLLGSKGRSNHPEIKAARAALQGLHMTARRHGWHNVNPDAIREACHALDRAMYAAGLKLGLAGKGLRDGK